MCELERSTVVKCHAVYRQSQLLLAPSYTHFTSLFQKTMTKIMILKKTTDLAPCLTSVPSLAPLWALVVPQERSLLSVTSLRAVSSAVCYRTHSLKCREVRRSKGWTFFSILGSSLTLADEENLPKLSNTLDKQRQSSMTNIKAKKRS